MKSGTRKRIRKTDAWGNTTTSDHGQYTNPLDSSKKITGVLLSQTDPLGVETAFEYNQLPEQQYRSFAHMFAAYVGSKIGDDSTQPGYLTGAQAQPSTIIQDAGPIPKPEEGAQRGDGRGRGPQNTRRGENPAASQFPSQCDFNDDHFGCFKSFD